jgi:hypothetical protein
MEYCCCGFLSDAALDKLSQRSSQITRQCELLNRNGCGVRVYLEAYRERLSAGGRARALSHRQTETPPRTLGTQDIGAGGEPPLVGRVANDVL